MTDSLSNPAVCRGCGQWPELMFGIWVPHRPNECPILEVPRWLEE